MSVETRPNHIGNTYHVCILNESCGTTFTLLTAVLGKVIELST